MSQPDDFKITVQLLGIAVNFVIPIITFVLGFIVSRFTMSKKERKDHLAKLQEESNKLSDNIHKRFEEFSLALHAYLEKKSREEQPNFTDFINISNKGEGYFSLIKMLSDSILSNNIDQQSVKNTHAPMIKATIERVIPEYYDTLQTIAPQIGVSYFGEFKRENYKSIFEVYEKYCK